MKKTELGTGRERLDWVNTVSLNHVHRGIAGGFMQADHGSDARLRRLQVGDRVVFYSPRTDYPEGRAGYLRWRTALKARHADEVAAILAEVGYGPDVIAQVQHIVRKESIKADPVVQTHEDALCLTFLQTQFAELADRLGDDKTIDVVRKTLAKMSERGRTEALGLPMSAGERALVERALAGS